jgi:hypothetical protein
MCPRPFGASGADGHGPRRVAVVEEKPVNDEREGTAHRLARTLLHSLPPSFGATLEYVLRPSVRNPNGGPLNGQRERQRIVLDLLGALPLRAIVETGTFRGSTTEFLATQSGLPLYTGEAVPRFYHYSRLRLRRFAHVRVVLGDSRALLARLADDPLFPKDDVFFYLDAHWYEDLPLRAEVELIARFWRGAVIMIDDFEVPGDAEYGFDDFGPGKRLCLDHLPPLATIGMEAYFPSAPARTESGARRGCVVLADRAAAARVAALPSLRGLQSSCLPASTEATGRLTR